MIEGRFERGVPVIDLFVAGRSWIATLDTGFDGFLELPEMLRGSLKAEYVGPSPSVLAGGHVVWDDLYEVTFPFDNEMHVVLANFAPGDGILVGTKMLDPYVLTVDFPARRVWLERE